MAGEIAVREPVVAQEVIPEVPPGDQDEEPSAVEEPTQAQTKTWQERVEEIRQEVGDDEFAKHPVVNARAQSIAAKQRKQWEQDQRQQAELSTRAAQWNEWFNSLPADQKLAHTENDSQEWRNVQVARKLLKSGTTGDPAYIAQNIVSNLEQLLKEDDVFTDADFEKLSKDHADDPAAWIKAIVAHGVARGEKGIPEKVKAGVAAELAKRAKGMESTENGPELHGPGSSKKGWSREDLARMSPEEYKRNQKDILEQFRR